ISRQNSSQETRSLSESFKNLLIFHSYRLRRKSFALLHYMVAHAGHLASEDGLRPEASTTRTSDSVKVEIWPDRWLRSTVRGLTCSVRIVRQIQLMPMALGHAAYLIQCICNAGRACARNPRRLSRWSSSIQPAIRNQVWRVIPA